MSRPVSHLLLVLVVNACALSPATSQTLEFAAVPTTLLQAVRTTLQNNPGVKVQQQQVRVAEGAHEIAKSQFDPTFSSTAGFRREKLPLSSASQGQAAPAAVETDVTSYSIRLSQQLRNGAVLGALVSSSRTADSTGRASGIPAQNLGRLDITLLLPLGRGAGIAATRPSTRSPPPARQSLSSSALLRLRPLPVRRSSPGLLAARRPALDSF